MTSAPLRPTSPATVRDTAGLGDVRLPFPTKAELLDSIASNARERILRTHANGWCPEYVTIPPYAWSSLQFVHHRIEMDTTVVTIWGHRVLVEGQPLPPPNGRGYRTGYPHPR